MLYSMGVCHLPIDMCHVMCQEGASTLLRLHLRGGRRTGIPAARCADACQHRLCWVFRLPLLEHSNMPACRVCLLKISRCSALCNMSATWPRCYPAVEAEISQDSDMSLRVCEPSAALLIMRLQATHCGVL